MQFYIFLTDCISFCAFHTDILSERELFSSGLHLTVISTHLCKAGMCCIKNIFTFRCKWWHTTAKQCWMVPMVFRWKTRCVSYEHYRFVFISIIFQVIETLKSFFTSGKYLDICSSSSSLHVIVLFSVTLLLVEFFRTLHIYLNSVEKYKAASFLWKPYCSMRLGNCVSLS